MDRDLLIQNLGWVVGNGQNINIWYDPWLDLSKQKRPYGPAPEALAKLTVADLRISHQGDWDIGKIRQILPQYEKDILAIKPSNENAPDRQVWLGTRSGTYSSKSGYYFATAIEEETEETRPSEHCLWYKNVWNLKVAPKVKMFAWKVLKRAVPVGERLVERHVDIDPRCKRCGEPESIIHLLFHCQFALQVWRDAPLALGFDPRGIVDLESRWTALCNSPCLPPTGLVTSQLFPWILWTLWKERNRYVFNGSSASPEETLATAIKAAKEWEQGTNTEKSISFKPPPMTLETHSASTIVRSDAAWRKEDKKAGLGWTVKTPRYEICKKKPHWNVSSPLVAEALAMREALLFCREHGLNNILLESDSSQLIKAINQKESISELHGILSDISQLSRPPEVSILFSWIPRNQNLVADSLSKEALCMVEAFIAPPNSV